MLFYYLSSHGVDLGNVFEAVTAAEDLNKMQVIYMNQGKSHAKCPKYRPIHVRILN